MKSEVRQCLPAYPPKSNDNAAADGGKPPRHLKKGGRLKKKRKTKQTNKFSRPGAPMPLSTPMSPVSLPQPLDRCSTGEEALSPVSKPSSFSSTVKPLPAQPQQTKFPWAALIVFLGVLVLLEAIVVLIYVSAVDAAEELADEKFRGISEYLYSRVDNNIESLVSSIGVMAAGFQAQVHPSSALNRVTASYMLPTASNLLSVSVWSERVDNEEDYQQLLAEFGYSNMSQRPPRALTPSGGMEVVSNLTARTYYFGVYFSDVPPDAPLSVIDSDFRMFVDITQEESRAWAIDSSLNTGLPYATLPTSLVAGTAGFSIFQAVNMWKNDTHTSDDMRGIVGIGVYSAALSALVNEDLAQRDPDLARYIRWDVVEEESRIATFSSEAFQGSDDDDDGASGGKLWQEVEYSFERKLSGLGRTWCVYVNHVPHWVEEAAGDPVLIIALGTVAVFFVAAAAGLFVLLLKRAERLKTRAAEAKQIAAEAQTSATELLLGYVNHEVRNPLNVLVASLEFVEEAVSRWRQHLKLPFPLSSTTEDNVPCTDHVTELTASLPPEIECKDGDTVERSAPSPGEGAADNPAILVTGEDAVRVLKDIASMRIAANQMERQVNEMLDFQQLRQGKIEIRHSACDLVRGLRRLANEHKVLTRVPIALEVKTPEGKMQFPSSVWTDEMRIQQLLANGLTNAIKFTKEGQIKVELSLESTSCVLGIGSEDVPPEFNGHGIFRLSVEDTGEGLAGVDVEQLFRPFFTTGSRVVEARDNHSRGTKPQPRKRVLKSTGLGLAICRIIASEMGGRISLKDIGQGCRFVAEIPVHYSDTTPPAISVRQPVSASSFSSSAPRVLVVDDMPNNVRLASRMLSKLGCVVDTLHDPNANFYEQVVERLEQSGQLAQEEGISVLQKGRESAPPSPLAGPYTFLFVDVMLGEENGVDIVQKLLPRLQQPKPWIIAMSAASTKDGEEFLRAGFQGAVPKPFSTRAFARVISKCLEAEQDSIGSSSFG